MNHAAGTKERIAERNRYRPSLAWGRESRITGKNGTTQTHKKAGDIIIDSQGKRTDVTKDGWE